MESIFFSTAGKSGGKLIDNVVALKVNQKRNFRLSFQRWRAGAAFRGVFVLLVGVIKLSHTVIVWRWKQQMRCASCSAVLTCLRTPVRDVVSAGDVKIQKCHRWKSHLCARLHVFRFHLFFPSSAEEVNRSSRNFFTRPVPTFQLSLLIFVSFSSCVRTGPDLAQMSGDMWTQNLTLDDWEWRLVDLWIWSLGGMLSWKRLNHNGNFVLGLINCPSPSPAIITIVRIPIPIMGSNWRYETQSRACGRSGRTPATKPKSEPHLTRRRRGSKFLRRCFMNLITQCTHSKGKVSN